MQFTFHGTGTALYGQRDYWPDGSFVTTEWVVAAWVPIFPTFSKRIAYSNQTNPFATYDASGYYIYETTAPNVRQTVYVYAWFAALIAILVGFGFSQDSLARWMGDEDQAAAVWFMAAAALLSVPHVLRRIAKRRAERQWRRELLGLGPDLK